MVPACGLAALQAAERVVSFQHLFRAVCEPDQYELVLHTLQTYCYIVYIYIYIICIERERERETIVMYQNAVKYNCSYRSLRSLPKALLLSHGTTPKSSSHNLPIRTWVRDPHHRICQIVDDCIIVITHDGSMVLVYIYIYANIKGVYWWDPCYQIYSIHGSYG